MTALTISTSVLRRIHFPGIYTKIRRRVVLKGFGCSLNTTIKKDTRASFYSLKSHDLFFYFLFIKKKKDFSISFTQNRF